MASDYRELARKVLGNPENYPDELKSWIPKILDGNPNLVLQQSQLPALEPQRFIGASGQPVFQGTWVNYGGGYDEANYYKDPWERVFVSGLVKLGTIGNVAFVLPAGYRPRSRMIFVGLDGLGAGVRLDVLATGDVIPIAGNNAYFAINVNFRAYS